MLSKEELSRYGTGTLTSVFLDCMYLECLIYDGEIVKTLSAWGLPLGVFFVKLPLTFLKDILLKFMSRIPLKLISKLRTV
jgi:hypothetical protein